MKCSFEGFTSWLHMGADQPTLGKNKDIYKAKAPVRRRWPGVVDEAVLVGRNFGKRVHDVVLGCGFGEQFVNSSGRECGGEQAAQDG